MGGGGGGRAQSLYATPPSPPPPRVLRDSGLGAMVPTARDFFCACVPFIKPSTLETFILAKTRKRYYHIRTPIPPYPQTYIPPGGMHVVVVGCAQAPPTLGTPPPPAEPPISPPPNPSCLPPPPQF